MYVRIINKRTVKKKASDNHGTRVAEKCGTFEVNWMVVHYDEEELKKGIAKKGIIEMELKDKECIVRDYDAKYVDVYVMNARGDTVSSY